MEKRIDQWKKRMGSPIPIKLFISGKSTIHSMPKGSLDYQRSRDCS